MDKNEIRAENISLICLLRTLKKNLWMIAAAAAIFAMLVSLYADFIRKPVYRASMTYAVTSRMSGYSTRNITAAKELASRGITVNAIAPGFIDTEMTAVLSDAVKENSRKQIPLGTFGKPEDVAGAVAFLVSEDAGYITGQVIHVDGGMC